MSKMLLAAFLVALPGCSTTKFITAKPPAELLADCPDVAERIATNGDLAWTILEYRKALGMCNLDKDSLRKWADKQ